MKHLHVEEPPEDLNELAENLMRDDRLWERADISIAVSSFKLTLGGYCPELQDDLPIPQDMTWCASVTATPADPAESRTLFTFRSWHVVPDGLRGISAQTGNVVELVMAHEGTVCEPIKEPPLDDSDYPTTPEGQRRITVIEPETAWKFPRARRPGYPVSYDDLALRWYGHNMPKEGQVITILDRRPERTLNFERGCRRIEVTTVSRYGGPWKLTMHCWLTGEDMVDGEEHMVTVSFRTWLYVPSGVRGIDEDTGQLTEILYDRETTERRKILE